MAFTINKVSSKGRSLESLPKEYDLLGIIEYNLLRVLSTSRFNARVERHSNKITIHDVRLKEKKDYCGNHPFACPVRPFETKHKKLKYLEGADWVGFNDMVNDVLDSLEVAANVQSSLVIIRKGNKRAVRYWGHATNFFNNEWNKDTGDFENWIGRKAPRSQFPEGTPGIAEYLI